ncbi:hypothetical protein HPB47_016969 [Ixodes persulcatus]|uniref:Uncharacterized protein n=1 Tax=Ixodes persulcatus TaxID=34615 RepID=A0AC60QPH9_IXOPE|nr:hypothetical protein HPB47_016969 [Ixodes persulcatus]
MVHPVRLLEPTPVIRIKYRVRCSAVSWESKKRNIAPLGVAVSILVLFLISEKLLVETCKHCEVLEVENNSLKSRMHELQEENTKLKTTIDYITSQRDGIEDLQTAASELLRFREELQEDRAARNSEKAENSANACQQEDDELVDLGGYKVNKAVIDMLKLGPAKTATTYARELLRQVFTTEELLGKSITGKQSNAHKEKEARPQLDPIRVNAVVKYTCAKFHLLKETTVRSSLSSMLNKGKEPSSE